jgi:hypothetical protein
MNMRKRMTMWVLVPIIALCCSLRLAKAQDSASASKAEQAEKPLHAYRLDFSLNEMDGDKRINSRRYTVDLTVPGDREEVKIGTRIPVATAAYPSTAPTSGTASTQFQYLDVGTHIWCSLKEHSGALELQAGGEVSSIDSEANHDSNGVPDPVIRQIKISGSTVVVPGKPIVIGSTDDPTSNRQFQLEVTVTQVK